MTLQECINAIDSAKTNNYTTAQKIEWLSFLEYTIINEVLKTHEGYNGEYDDFNGYTEEDVGVTLIITSPYESVYVDYLEMRIDEANGETSLYNASASQYNTKLLEYKKWYNKTHMPLSVKAIANSNNKQDVNISQDDINTIATMVYSRLLPEVGTKIETEVENSLSDTNIYTVVTDYMTRNGDRFKGKDGTNGKDGKDGAKGNAFTYKDLTTEQRNELSGNARLAEAWAVGSSEFAQTLQNNAKYYAQKAADNLKASEEYYNGTVTQAGKASDYAANAQVSAQDAADMALEAESFAHGNTGRDGEDVDNAMYYCEKAKDIYNSLIKVLSTKISGTGAVKLEDVNMGINTARVECSYPVTMYGKNLTNFVGNWSGTFASNGRPYFIINVPCNVTLSVTRKDNGAGTNNAGAVNVYKSKTQDFAEREPVGEQIASGKVFPPLQIQYEEGYYYCVSTTTAATGFFTHIQTEVGSASSYEKYKEPKPLADLNDVKLYSPTATLIAESPNAPITATYTKDINRTIERLENAIANS